LGNILIRTLKRIRQPDFEFFRHRLDTEESHGGAMGSPLLAVGVYIAAQCYDTIFDSNPNLRSFKSRLLFKLIHNILLYVYIGLHGNFTSSCLNSPKTPNSNVIFKL
jgi:hypothetical protein